METKKITVAAQVQAYLATHPNAKAKEIAETLALKAGTVAAVMSKLNKPATSKKNTTSGEVQDPLENLRSNKTKLEAQLNEKVSRLQAMSTLEAEVEAIRDKLARTQRAIDSLEESEPSATNDITDPDRVAGESHASA